MTRATEEKLRQLTEHPPEGSAIAEAKKFGVDLNSILENLKLSPERALAPGGRGNGFCPSCSRKTEAGQSVSGVEQLLGHLLRLRRRDVAVQRLYLECMLVSSATSLVE